MAPTVEQPGGVLRAWSCVAGKLIIYCSQARTSKGNAGILLWLQLVLTNRQQIMRDRADRAALLFSAGQQ